MTDALRKILNCSFVLVLFLPLVIFSVTPLKGVSKSEKRKLAPFPAIEWHDFSLVDFSQNFELFWNDHFGLREKFVAFNSILHQQIFNKSSVKEVIQGKDGWLFFNFQSSVYDFLGILQPDQKTLQSWAKTLENREKWLEERNIHYLVLPVPNKINIYSEFLPTRYTFLRDKDTKSKLDLLMDYLGKNSSFSSIVNLTPVYLSEKKNNQLYFKTDSHWTRQGAYLGYAEIMKQLNRWYPELQPIPYKALSYKRAQRKGDLANMMGTTPEEQYREVKIRKSCSSKMFKLPHHNPRETRRYPMVTTCDKAKLTAVVTYDSFGRFLFPYYAEHFKRVVYVSRYDNAWLKKFLDEERPDVFIHQRAAREIEKILVDDWGLDDKPE